MDYGGKFYYGIIIATENNDDSDAQYNSSDDNSQKEVGLLKSPLNECGSDDDILPIIKKKTRIKLIPESWTNKELERKSRKINKRSPKANEAANLGNEDSNEKLCEHPNCSFEIYSACICLKVLLCSKHFKADNNCRLHQDYNPESLFPVEGSQREVSFKKVRKINSYKLAKELKNKGQYYIRPKTMNLMPPKQLGPRCNGESCSKRNKKCSLFSDGKRQEIVQDFYSMRSLQLQREYIARYIKMEEIKQKITQKQVSRRNKSIYYFLPLDGDELSVCKTFFINNLATTAKTISTTGNIEKKTERRKFNQKEINSQKQELRIAQHRLLFGASVNVNAKTKKRRKKEKMKKNGGNFDGHGRGTGIGKSKSKKYQRPPIA
ncbi:unnamed protein product [Psylliodes chrysocephalus]|uniref:Uncharacterized protein n=1 Tax=Psylliodes chrysocephalus TaxID=3402493 RepID=A0A9P0G6A9_9CUCU|nr:unnamed protein product [Psylliodes chrysocephala]